MERYSKVERGAFLLPTFASKLTGDGSVVNFSKEPKKHDIVIIGFSGSLDGGVQ
jgi:hypothetical protein